jgi:hypothetical protein
MASDTSLFKLGMVSITTKPSLFSGTLTTFTQSLNLSTATVTISATSAAGSAVFSAFVDASSNTIEVTGSSSIPVTYTVEIQSLHPGTANFTYGGGFGGSGPTCRPDTLEADPPAIPNTIRTDHRNEDTDQPAAFNDTLVQQGLASLVPLLQGSDRWRHRQFGMVLSGPGLGRVSPTMLQSETADSSFRLTVSTHSNQTATSAEWHHQLTTQHQKRVASSTRRAHEDWWSAFWERSYIVVHGNTTMAADAAVLTQQYAVTRYLQAVQARTWVPLKFNGQAFGANLPPETLHSGPTFRDWGANSW